MTQNVSKGQKNEHNNNNNNNLIFREFPGMSHKISFKIYHCPIETYHMYGNGICLVVWSSFLQDLHNLNFYCPFPLPTPNN